VDLCGIGAAPDGAGGATGALVQIKDHRQRFLGVGFYNSKSKIQVRVLAPERVEVNAGFFSERIPRCAGRETAAFAQGRPPFA